MTENSADIEWQAPEQDGGAPINKYVVEYRPANRSTWTKAGTVDGDTYKFNVKDLKEGQDYYFRVTAVNSEGPGSPLESNDLAKPRKIIGKGENNSRFL